MKMAPAKQNGTTAALLPLIRKTISTRSKATTVSQNQNTDDAQQQPLQRGKRKADVSPLKYDRGVKRSALCNLTNAANVPTTESDSDAGGFKGLKVQNVNGATGKVTGLLQVASNIGNNKKTAKTVTEVFTKPDPDGPKTRAATKILTRAASRQKLDTGSSKPTATKTKTLTASIGHALKDQLSAMTTTIVKPKEMTADGGAKLAATSQAAQQGKPKRRISNEFEKTEDSLYVSALEDITSSGSLRLSDNFGSRSATPKDSAKGASPSTGSPQKRTPDGVEDYDLVNWNDVFQVSHYAHEIFQYQKDREPTFAIPDYMTRQPHISKWMRALLVDWMVEIQESFELNHETLYLAVKIVDIYLSRMEIQKDSLQLLGAAALFIAAKYDERVPPTVDDFHYICDGAYQRREMILMEMTVFKTIGYDLGIPLSYRFLRRYARVNRIDMPVLTLARYILEFSLMDYAIVQLSDSKLACAALFIAMRMNNMPGWNKTLEFYSGYKIEDFAAIAVLLNNIMTRKPKESLNTVRHKYSHELFFESAKKPFITDLRVLFDTTGLDLTAIQQLQVPASSLSMTATVSGSSSARSAGTTTAV
ncbi:G2/mitotic-specific cyclin-B3 [Culex quinquefasciatus]|uniref:G2/mitotic-specific cyclin-B3 n=1 Tax=Culex quinquefasciatus TaxID=7176 RepID=UPI0018E298BB|nr:G2/mitotic-specific cyclin-B3 [Culex quinquefasciatus]